MGGFTPSGIIGGLMKTPD